LTGQRDWKGTSIFDEMCAELGIRVHAEAEVPAALAAVRMHFAAELDFLASRPDIVDTPACTFVHGGLPSEDIDALADENAYSVLKFDAFADRVPAFRKWIVTGHWPTANYHDRIPCHNPVFFHEKRILAIDGGCGILQDGQLNMMIFPSIDCAPEDITFVSHDDHPTVRALDAQAESADSINIRWIDHDIRVLTKDEDFADIEHVRTGHRLNVPTALLLSDTAVRDCTDYRLPVEPGDTLHVIMETAEGILAKKNAVTGWYYGAFTYR
ncbi:MAG: hypothetical protein J6C52_00815, partial [Clostridia bacterium]|nr:hypothetical protein [Clostridia bacterium]